MKPSPNNLLLENFICESLKNLDVREQPDWNEMDMMLGPEHKSISIGISKKTILISTSVFVLAAIIIILSQTIHFNSSSSSEESEGAPLHPDSVKTTMPVADTQKISVPKVDSIKKDTSLFVKEQPKTDSSAALVNDTSEKITEKEKNSHKKDKKKKEKNQNADSSSNKTNVELPAVVDTAKKLPVQETKIEMPKTISTDSSKTTAPEKKNKKNRKHKNSSSDSSKVKIAKSDSLK